MNAVVAVRQWRLMCRRSTILRVAVAVTLVGACHAPRRDPAPQQGPELSLDPLDDNAGPSGSGDLSLGHGVRHEARLTPSGTLILNRRPGGEVLRVRTVWAGRGSVPMLGPHPVVAVERRGPAVVVVRGPAAPPAGSTEALGPGLEERFSRIPGGVEQSWVVPRPLPGSGPLRVRVALTGDTGAFRYGAATLVGASGRRFAVPSRRDPAGVTLEVPAGVLAAARYPAVLDPAITAEKHLEAPVFGPPVDHQEGPSIAYDGTRYLVVWRDLRPGGHYDIYGVRVDPTTGKRLDTHDLPLGTQAGSQDHPWVAGNAGTFVVVWETHGGKTKFDVHGAVLSGSNPSPSTIKPMVISAAPDDQAAPRVAVHGARFLVVWEDKRLVSHFDIRGARVDATGSGKVLDPAGIPICLLGAHKKHPDVAASGSDALVVWTDARAGTHTDIYGARVTSAGQVLDAVGKGIWTGLADQSVPRITPTSSGYWVSFVDTANNPSGDVRAVALDRTAKVLTPSGVVVSQHSAPQEFPALHHQAGTTLVVWRDRRLSNQGDIYGARLGSSNKLLDPLGFQVSGAAGHQERPAVCGAGTDFFAVWQDRRSGSGYAVYGSRVSAAGSVMDAQGLLLSRVGNPQVAVDAAFDGTRYLVVWEDHRDRQVPAIRAVRVSAAGTVLDAPSMALSGSTSPARKPAVMGEGGRFLVAWQEGASGKEVVRAVRVDGSSGKALDPAALSLAGSTTTQRSPCAARLGTGSALVVWASLAGSSATGDIRGTRVDLTSGKILDPSGLALSTAAGTQDQPAAGGGSAGALVVWSDRRSTSTRAVYGARVDLSGKVLDTQGFVVSAGTGHRQNPTVGWNGSRYLVAWEDSRAGGGARIYGTRVDGQTGKVADPAGVAFSAAGALAAAPHAAAGPDWGHYTVWEARNSSGGTTLRMARVTSGGKLLFPIGMDLLMLPGGEQAPALVVGTSDTWLLAYPRFDPVSGGGVNRARARVLAVNPTTGLCTAHHHCASGYCQGGVCAPLPDGGFPADAGPDAPPPDAGKPDARGDLAPDREAVADLGTSDLTQGPADRGPDTLTRDGAAPRLDIGRRYGWKSPGGAGCQCRLGGGAGPLGAWPAWWLLAVGAVLRCRRRRGPST